jgi:hypothetical protein
LAAKETHSVEMQRGFFYAWISAGTQLAAAKPEPADSRKTEYRQHSDFMTKK